MIAKPSLDEYIANLEATGRMTSAVSEAAENARLRQNKRVLYIAGPLTGMSDEVKERYRRLSDLAAGIPGWFGYAPHLHGTDPVKHPSVSPGEVRDIDFLWAIVVADAHVNCLHPLAHGNGIEEGWAEMAAIPTIYLAPEDVILSRLVRGMRNVIETIPYANFDDCLSRVRRRLVEVAGTLA